MLASDVIIKMRPVEKWCGEVIGTVSLSETIA